jgi:hypothetical protein
LEHTHTTDMNPVLSQSFQSGSNLFHGLLDPNHGTGRHYFMCSSVSKVRQLKKKPF